ncbi:MAG: alpha/beta hydrolase [Alphaproteobacteria bacterium]|nr:alpha/beta hydrolase [Alphaproteobacteria bacterium]
MAVFTIGPDDGLYYEHRRPSQDDGATFVFFNALTGDTGAWEASIGPALREAGHGTLMWNFRGQKDSPFSSPEVISADGIVDDAIKLIQAETPRRPVYVGLSIGGLFAAQAHLKGVAREGSMPCEGLLFINTLRKFGPRLDWTNRAAHRAALVGGGRLIQDLMLPHLTGPAWQAANSAKFLQDEPYEPLDPDSGPARLLAAGIGADWNVAYEKLAMPTTVLSGLQDHVFYNAGAIAELTKRLPNAEKIDIADIGHLVTMERPAAITRACLALADRLN